MLEVISFPIHQILSHNRPPLSVPLYFKPSSLNLSFHRFFLLSLSFYYSLSPHTFTGVVAGDNVSIFYDPMIAKLVVHSENRNDALAVMDRALSEFR